VARGDNLIGKGFDSRTTEEVRELARIGGKKSGEARRRKANFRKTLNMLLTAEVDIPDWTAFLESIGLDSTIESVVNAAMIREAMAGNVKAYEAIAKYSGQDARTEKDLEEQIMKMEAFQKQMDAKMEEIRLKTEKMKKELDPEDKDVEIKVEIDEDWSI
jgi:hypothetical protein